MRHYKITNPWTGEVEEVALEIGYYRKPKRLALQLYVVEDGTLVEPYATVSVNLPEENCGEWEFFVDSNNCPWAMDWLMKNGIAEPCYVYGFSGYCCYPMMRLSKRLIAEEKALRYAEKRGVCEYHVDKRNRMVWYASFPLEHRTYKVTFNLDNGKEERTELKRYYVAYKAKVGGKYQANYMD